MSNNVTLKQLDPIAASVYTYMTATKDDVTDFDEQIPSVKAFYRKIARWYLWRSQLPAAKKTAKTPVPAAAKAAGTKAIPADVLGILRDNLVWVGNGCTIIGQLARPLYVKVNEVLEAAGGKWNKKAKMHLFESDDAELLIREAIALGHYIDAKTAFQFFETPMMVSAKVANLLVEKYLDGRSAVVDPIGREKINAARMLEPSAGNGNLINSARNAGVHSKNTTAYDINQKCVDTLIRKFPGMTVALQDFLAVPTPDGNVQDYYDLILMNPPFTQLNDVKHVSHALGFLKPGGVLVAIMSPAWTYRETKLVSAFKLKLDGYVTPNVKRYSFKHSWELLPDNSFAESGTGVRTGVLTVQRE